MDWLGMLIGCILGLAIVSLKELSSKEERRRTLDASHRRIHVPKAHLLPPNFHQELERSRQRIRRLQELSKVRRIVRLRRTRDKSGSTLVKRWRKGIAGLIKLADNNLAIAKYHLEMRRFEQAVEAASTSVENIARALIHCYGGKPDPDSGQEEPLRMLSQRFLEDEKVEFDKAVNTVAHIANTKMSLPYQANHISSRKVQIQSLDEATTRKTLDSASTVVHLFKRILSDHFAAEIPELDEACPECGSLNIGAWSFNEAKVNYECNNCHHKWTAARKVRL